MSTPPHASFFVTGGTLRSDAPSYVARPADRDLFDNLVGGEYCFVLNTRQMGKSSLMVQTAARLRAAGHRFAVLDLTAVGQNLSPEQWYEGLLVSLGQQLGLEDALDDYWLEHPHLGPFQRLFAALQEVALPAAPTPLTVFVDEIDAVRSLRFPADELFAGIRACYNARTLRPELERLTFCLLGVATPAELISDTRISPFNVGKRIRLTDFTLAEAEKLARGLAGGSAVLARVLYWTAGQPYMTQRLCRAAAEDAAVIRARDVDRLCAELFLSQQARESDDHLAFVRNRLLKAHDDLAAVLDLYRQVQSGRNIPDDETNPLCAVLKLSGVCREEQGRLRVRNRVYARVFDRAWVEAQLPNAEVERQKAAYRRGLMRASALAGVVLALMAGLTGWAVRSDRTSRRAARAARAQTALARESEGRARESEARAQWLGYSSAMDIIQHEWDSNTLYHAPELLDATEHNPYRGFEWGYWNRLCHAETGVLRGHTGEIGWAEFSRDGRQVVTGSWDHTARVWDVSTGRSLLELKGHTHMVTVAEFSPDEKLILTASADKTLRLWDAATGRRLRTLTGHKEGMSAAFFSPDGARIVSASDDRTARVWDTRSGRELLTLRGHTDVLWGAKFSPDGRRIVTASIDGTARLWDATSGRGLHVLKGHASRAGVPEQGVAWAAFSPDSRRVVTSGADGTVRLWDAAAGKALRVLKVSADPIYCSEFTRDGKRLWIAGKDRTARLWEVEPGRELRVIRGHTARVWYAVYSPDGNQVLTTSGDGTARFWDAANDTENGFLRGNGQAVFHVACSRDGRRIVTAGGDSTVRVWDAATRRPLLVLKGHTGVVNDAEFSPDGSRIVTAGTDRTARLWDTKTGRQLRVWQGQAAALRSAVFSPDGARVATASREQTARVWDAETGRELLALRGHTGAVNDVEFSPDGRRLVTASADRTVRVWDAASGRQLLRWTANGITVFTASFSPDGGRIVTVGHETMAKVWEAATGKEVLQLKGRAERLIWAGYTPDGKRIVTATSDDGRVRVWDAASGYELLALSGQTRRMPTYQEIGYLHGKQAVAFSSDSAKLFTASADGIVRIFDSSPRGGSPLLRP